LLLTAVTNLRLKKSLLAVMKWTLCDLEQMVSVETHAMVDEMIAEGGNGNVTLKPGDQSGLRCNPFG